MKKVAKNTKTVAKNTKTVKTVKTVKASKPVAKAVVNNIVNITMTRNQANALREALSTLGHFSKTSKYSALVSVYSATERALNS